ncbi:hypothetical protein ACIQWN_37200 [Streptomyces vinaceus]|uniref:hypothetical protein n=1 Tax=Streptomyces vinaceus TaxID=1960 RepID=UPI003806E36E
MADRTGHGVGSARRSGTARITAVAVLCAALVGGLGAGTWYEGAHEHGHGAVHSSPARQLRVP